MSKLAVGVTGVVVISAAAAVWLQHLDNVELRREVSLLRGEVQGVMAAQEKGLGAARVAGAGSTSAPAGPGGEIGVGGAEWAKLRDEVTAVRKSTQEIVQFVQASSAMKTLAATDAAVPTKLTPADALKNAGRLTPEAAAETALWAAVGGDVDTLSNALSLTATARQKADAWFAGLSDATRQQYGTPEKVIALMIARDAAGLSGMQILGQKEVAPDTVGVRLRFGSTDGKTKDDNLLLRRSSDGWRMVIPDTAVEKFARQLGGR